MKKKIMEMLAMAYCNDRNSKKIVDVDLCSDMADLVEVLFEKEYRDNYALHLETKPMQVIWYLFSGYIMSRLHCLIPRSWKLHTILSEYINRQYRKFFSYWTMTPPTQTQEAGR